jgi:transposase
MARSTGEIWPVERSRAAAQRGRKRGAEAQCIGRSRGGLTSKIHALVDALGNPVHLHITPGNVADVSEASRLSEAAQGENFIADKGYDADFVVAAAKAKGMNVVIPAKSNRRNPRQTDFYLYKERHLVENFFCKLKHFRRVATRYEKTARNFLGFLLLASIKIGLQ